ncbi:FMN-binding negative transcriptional regulator [Saccharomonospora sp. NPDC046836]|uniref:FMN-binding negative transcriptional regulator n=1 Tax=Saccharomonospora sp. NPDC046836 TaxID=3156921 RepID=UPI0033D94970
MHTYPRYAAPSQRAIVDLVREHPFAVLVSTAPGEAPVASHLPLILPTDIDPCAPLDGTILLGHMGRKNPHWQQLTQPSPVLLIFSSVHGYVSPQLYDFTPAAPTLDYAAVHLTGVIELIDDPDESMAVVEATVAALESRRPTQWDPAESREFFARILPGIVAFRVRVTKQQAMFKLSQDMPAHVTDNVRNDFASGPHRHPQLVELMDRMPRDTPL